MECGTPPGNSQRSPSCTSSTNARPFWSTAVIPALPAVINAHSEPTCQCSSRTPPEMRRISTPAIFFDSGKSRTVTWRVQPPDSMRLCDKANEYLNGGCPPASVSGGYTESGSCASSPGFFGPNSCSLMPVCVSLLISFVCCAAARIERLAAATRAAEVFPKNDRRLTPSLLIPPSCSVIFLPPFAPFHRHRTLGRLGHSV